MAMACRTVLLLSALVAAANAATSALIVFGDSTVDTGTNFHTPSPPFNFQANRFPYGFRAFNEKGSGRFTEGRVIVDFIAELAGFPLIEPFAKPGATFTRGVNFGNQGMVIPLSQQLENFNKFTLVSKDKNVVEFEEYISNAVFLISIGSNDYLSGLFSSPDLQKRFTPVEFVSSNITQPSSFCSPKELGSWWCLEPGLWDASLL